MRVHQVMTEKVSFVDPDMRIPEIARRMRDEDIGSLPVAEDERLVGIVTDRDIVVRAVAEGQDARETTARRSCRQRSSTASKTTASRKR